MALPRDDFGSEPLTSEWVNAVAKLFRPVSVGAGGAAGSYTLTDDEAAYGTIVATGTLTGNRNVILPNDERMWDVVNSTSGAFTLTFKTAAGTGIVVGSGKSARLRGDGTNILRFTADV